LSKTFVKGGVINPDSHEEIPTDRGKSYRLSTESSRRSKSSSNRDNLQQQIAKSNAAAQAAAAAVSTPVESKPVSCAYDSIDKTIT
jgi:hypothetical protein